MLENEDGQSNYSNAAMFKVVFLATGSFGCYTGAQLLASVAGPYTSSPFSLIGLAVEGLFCIAVAIVSYFGWVERPKPFLVAAALLEIPYAFLAFAAPDSGVLQILLRINTALIAGVMVCVFAGMFSRTSTRVTIVCIAAGYVIAAFWRLFASLVFPDHSLFVQIAIYVASIVFAFAVSKEILPRAHVSVDGLQLMKTKSLEASYSRVKRAVVGAAVFASAYGIILQSDVVRGASPYSQSDQLAVFTIMISLALIAYGIFAKRLFSIDYIILLIVPLFSLIIVFKLLFPDMNQLVGSLLTLILTFYYMVLWITMSAETQERRLPTLFVFGLAFGATRLGLFFGRGLVFSLNIIEPFESSTALDTTLVAAATLCFLLIGVSVYLFLLLREKNRDEALGCVDPSKNDRMENDRIIVDEDSGEAETVTHEKWRTVANRFKLSPREANIVEQYATGRSAVYIADQMNLSEHTIKTHLKNAYSKMNVHSRQQLLDLMQEAPRM